MKKILTTALTFALLSTASWAQQEQDTMFVHIGQTVYEFPTKEVDSIIFYRTAPPALPMVPVEGITLNPISAMLEVNETLQLTATISPTTATNKTVVWISTNSSVATVSNGLVTAKGRGTTFIHAITVDGLKVAFCEIRVIVTEAGPFSITWDPVDFINTVTGTPDQRGGFSPWQHTFSTPDNLRSRGILGTPQMVRTSAAFANPNLPSNSGFFALSLGSRGNIQTTPQAAVAANQFAAITINNSATSGLDLVFENIVTYMWRSGAGANRVDVQYSVNNGTSFVTLTSILVAVATTQSSGAGGRREVIDLKSIPPVSSGNNLIIRFVPWDQTEGSQNNGVLVIASNQSATPANARGLVINGSAVGDGTSTDPVHFTEVTGVTTFNYQPLSTNINVFYHIPAGGDIKTMPILFVMHGTNRNADGYRDTWRNHANNKQVIIIAPEFPNSGLFAGSSGYNQGRMFSGSTLRPREQWTFSIIEALFDFVVADLRSTQTKYDMWGHSAGGQFAHRYVLFMPEARLNKAVAANSGWYTVPNLTVDFPHGLRNSPATATTLETSFAKNLIIALGTLDNDPNAADLNRDPITDIQGTNRFDRGNYFMNVATTNSAGKTFNWTKVEVPGIAHSSSGMATGTVNILYP